MITLNLQTKAWREFAAKYYFKHTPPVIIHSPDSHLQLKPTHFHYSVRYYHDMMSPPHSEWIVPNTLNLK